MNIIQRIIKKYRERIRNEILAEFGVALCLRVQEGTVFHPLETSINGKGVSGYVYFIPDNFVSTVRGGQSGTLKATWLEEHSHESEVDARCVR